MKVESTRSARQSGGTRAAKRGEGPSGGFAREMKQVSGDAGGEEVAAAAPPGTVDALLAVQEAGDATEGGGNARGRAWGVDVLDRLEEIRLGILTGSIPYDRLQALARMVGEQRERADDPRLAAILDDIELRARVELAKLERSR